MKSSLSKNAFCKDIFDKFHARDDLTTNAHKYSKLKFEHNITAKFQTLDSSYQQYQIEDN